MREKLESYIRHGNHQVEGWLLEGAIELVRRFAAAQIGADVTEEGRRLHVVVDESLAQTVDELVTWPGTLLVYDPDPTYAPVPPDAGRAETAGGGALAAREATLADGTVERLWVGSHTDVHRAVSEWPVDASHRLVAEAIWDASAGVTAGSALWRTRAVLAIPVGPLGDGILVGRGDEGTLRLRALPGSPSAATLHDAKERARPPVLVRGRTSLGAPALTGDAAILSFGAGIRSYARAQEERLLLTTPRLPVLRRVGAVGLPPNTTLATACYLVPVALSLLWLVFVRRFDRAHPEPMWLVLVTFLMGAVATVPAGLLERALSSATPWLEPRVVTFGGQAFALPFAIVAFTLVVGLVEEGTKLAGAVYAVRRKEFDEPVDGIVYGIASSLGFAAAENFHYFTLSRLNAPTVIARCFMSVPAHMFFGALWGYALGARLVERRSRVALFVGLAALGHGLFDAFLSTDGAGLLAVLLNVGLASAFIVLVRRALRHGVVDDAVRAVSLDERLLFRVGRPGLFALSSASLHVLAFGLFTLGAFYQFSRHRPGPFFVVTSSVLLALLAVAAFGVTWTMPLDVAVDDYGVTFAGAARPWRRIRAFEARARHVVLDCEGGPLLLGPAAPAVVSAMAGALREHVGAPGDRRRDVTLESGLSPPGAPRGHGTEGG
jgi:RsiW-degrading membrane proteinase PrsW (M82 family)